MKRKRGILLMTAGLLFVITALFLVIYNLWEGQKAAKDSEGALEAIGARLEETIIIQPASGQEQEKELTVYEVDGVGYIGALEIPALERKLPVISEWNYNNLKKAICRYKGSPYTGDFIIAGHNYRTHFSGLSKLAIGDSVKFTDMDGKQFLYQVSEFEKMPKTAVEQMEEGDWDLTLFTCDYGGRNRVAVRCVEVQ